ncbi:MAG: hypothetical protein QXS21_07175 [Thermoproteota archaeon]
MSDALVSWNQVVNTIRDLKFTILDKAIKLEKEHEQNKDLRDIISEANNNFIDASIFADTMVIIVNSTLMSAEARELAEEKLAKVGKDSLVCVTEELGKKLDDSIAKLNVYIEKYKGEQYIKEIEDYVALLRKFRENLVGFGKEVNKLLPEPKRRKRSKNCYE